MWIEHCSSTGVGRIYSVSVFLILVGLAAFLIAIVAMAKGRLRWARITSRKVAAIVLAGGFAVLVTGTALASAAPRNNPGPAAAPQPTTTVVQTTVEPTTTIVVPATTTTTVRPTTTTVRPTTTRVVVPTHIVHTTTRPKPVVPANPVTCS